MEINKYIEYVKYFSYLFNEKDISVMWRQKNVGINFSIDIESELPKINSSFNEKEFMEISFEILSLSRLISRREFLDDDLREVNDKTEDIKFLDKIDIISEYFLNDDLIQYINVQTQSITNVLDEVDYEILTKRSKKTPEEIISHSLLLRLSVRDNYSKEDQDNVERITVELTKSEVEKTIELLNEALSSLEKIK
ncbi:hypothetical protein [Bacillus sp. 03113]|uniref:hypothetical protein n=1 Tax=Bacillus sp. 03113 TaxID=2578211 RepID=UPI001141D2DC|nr:hypothetical protein [Bacillus sp. 03113]